MQTTMLPLVSILLLGGCFMPASAANRARDRDMQRVRAEAAAEWSRIDQQLTSRGWRAVAEPAMGALEEKYDESDEVRITLPEGGNYALVGICGANCIDMDLVIWNSARRRVGGDVEPDARPIAVFEGAAGERFTAVVTIPTCRRPPRNPRLNEDPTWSCIYFTRLYRRGG
jgi:hypothetical protein